MEDEPVKHETIIFTDAETGTETKMAILGTVSHNGADYILVCAAAENGAEPDEADILRLSGESGDDLIYENVTDEDELEAVAALFMASDDELTIEM